MCLYYLFTHKVVNLKKTFCIKYFFYFIYFSKNNFFETGSWAQWIECLPKFRETGIQSQVQSYQRLKKKWYLISPCLTLSIIRYVSRVKWSNPGKGVAPSPTPWCSSYWKGSLRVILNYSCQLFMRKFFLGQLAFMS